MKNFGNITAHGQVYLLPDKPPADLVWTDPKGHENFWCSVTGGTSGSSSNPRTEGRETLVDTGTAYNWAVGEALHSMSGTVRVELAPSSGKVIVGQIHAHKGPDTFIMVTWWNGMARIDIRTDPFGSAGKYLEVACPLGKAFKYAVTIDRFRMLTINLNGQVKALPVSKEWDSWPFYFKQGAYVIDHEGPEYEGGWVVYEDSVVSHLTGDA